MGKHFVCTLASTMALGLTTIPATSVMAQQKTEIPIQKEEVQKIEIKTAQDFITYYLSVEKRVEDVQKEIELKKKNNLPVQPISWKNTYVKNTISKDGKIVSETMIRVLIETVDQTNFQTILNGKKVYDTFKPEFQKEISTLILQQTKKDYTWFIEEATKQEEIFKKEQELNQNKPDGLVDPNQKEPVHPPVVLPIDPNSPEENVGQEVKPIEPEVDSQEDLTDKNESNDQDVEAQPEEEPEETIPQLLVQSTQPKIIESSLPQTTVQEPVQANEQAPVVEVVQTPVVLPKQEAKDMTAEGFIKQYLTGANGHVYSVANALNYKNILSAMPAYTQLTSAQRKAVNSILKKEVGKTFNQLLQEAQSIQLNGTTNLSNGSTVDTGSSNQAGLYGALTGLSIALFGFLNHKEKEESAK